MFKRGDRVKLTYYEFDQRVESHNWTVKNYNNGLIKVSRELPASAEVTLLELGQKLNNKSETVVFNLRSIGFLKAQLIE